jgi:hypothetical protein
LTSYRQARTRTSRPSTCTVTVCGTASQRSSGRHAVAALLLHAVRVELLREVALPVSQRHGDHR